MIFIIQPCVPQNSQGKETRRWILFHPLAALKVKSIYKKHLFVYQNNDLLTVLDSFENGGKLDAFRHVYFMAAFAQKISVNKLRKLGIAHEKTNRSSFFRGKESLNLRHDSLGSVMDLQNNELGFMIGHGNKNLNPLSLRDTVLSEILSGKALIFNRNKHGLYLDCSDQVLDPILFKLSWYIPKCLVNSNLIYKD